MLAFRLFKPFLQNTSTFAGLPGFYRSDKAYFLHRLALKQRAEKPGLMRFNYWRSNALSTEQENTMLAIYEKRAQALEVKSRLCKHSLK